MFPKIWNKLNPKFQEIASFGLFKRSVRAGYLEEYWIMFAVKIPHAINVISHHNGLKQLFNFTVYQSKFIYDLLVVESAEMNELNPPSAQPFHHAIHRNLFIYIKLAFWTNSFF